MPADLVCTGCGGPVFVCLSYTREGTTNALIMCTHCHAQWNRDGTAITKEGR